MAEHLLQQDLTGRRTVAALLALTYSDAIKESGVLTPHNRRT
jgi:hypothetical protein